jgi:hypothetical protein
MRRISRKSGQNPEVLVAVVVTVIDVELPAVTVAGLNVQVATGGQPATTNEIEPESGGARVAMVNAAEPPADIVVEVGIAFTPTGDGPLK